MGGSEAVARPRARCRARMPCCSSASLAYSEQRRREPAGARQKRRNQPLIGHDRAERDPRPGRHGRGPGMAASAPRSSAASAANGSRSAAGRPMITSAACVGRRVACRPIRLAQSATSPVALRRRRELPTHGEARPSSARSSRARARSWTVDRFACLAERAPETQRWWSTARVAGIGPSHGQPFAPLRAPTLEHLSPALGLHSLAEAVGLLPSAQIGLKRPLHELVPPRDRRTDSVDIAHRRVNSPFVYEDACDSL